METPLTQTGLWIDKPASNIKIQLRHDLPVPSPGPGQVLVKIEYSGLCHSDIANIFGRHHMSADVHTPGHEGIGHVVAPSNHALLGKRVGVRWMASACLDCEICAVNETSCPRQSNHGRNVEGTLKQYTLADERFAVPVPEALAAEEAAPLLCAGISQFSAIQKSGAKDGEFLVNIGAGGGLGHLGVQIARHRGLKVIAIDTGSEKRDFCLSLGATAFVDYKTDDVVTTVKNLTDSYGAHAVICTAGSTAAYDLAFRLVRPQGTVVCVGLPGLDYRLPVAPMDLVQGGLTITGTSNGTRSDMKEFFAMAERGEVKSRVEVFELEDAADVVRKVEKGDFVGRAVFRLPK